MLLKSIPIAVLAALLAGCVTLPGLKFNAGPKTELPPENQPDDIRFRVGDRYVFDNPPTIWEIVGIKGERVLWRSDSGDKQITGFNPLLPAREWRSRNDGSGRRMIRDQKGELFPMKIGAAMSYRSTVTSSKPPFGWELNWSCEVTGKEAVTVAEKKFDTFVVRCVRENADSMTFYYAPTVGHFVRQHVAATASSPALIRNLIDYKHVRPVPPVVQPPATPVAAAPQDTPQRSEAKKPITKTAKAGTPIQGPSATAKRPAANKKAPPPEQAGEKDSPQAASQARTKTAGRTDYLVTARGAFSTPPTAAKPVPEDAQETKKPPAENSGANEPKAPQAGADTSGMTGKPRKSPSRPAGETVAGPKQSSGIEAISESAPQPQSQKPDAAPESVAVSIDPPRDMPRPAANAPAGKTASTSTAATVKKAKKPWVDPDSLPAGGAGQATSPDTVDEPTAPRKVKSSPEKTPIREPVATAKSAAAPPKAEKTESAAAPAQNAAIGGALASVILRPPTFGGKPAPPRKTVPAKAGEAAAAAPGSDPAATSPKAVPPPPAAKARIGKSPKSRASAPPRGIDKSARPPSRRLGPRAATPRNSTAQRPRPAVPPPARPVAKKPQPSIFAGPRASAPASAVGPRPSVPPPPKPIRRSAVPPVPPPPKKRPAAAEPPTTPQPTAISPPAKPVQQPAPAVESGKTPLTQLATAKSPGVHLASYRDAGNARRGWEQLTRRNGDLLDGLHAEIRRVDVSDKGVYFRLYAAPVPSSAAAAELCRKLRQRGVYCSPQES